MRMLVGWCWRYLKICFHRLKILCVLSLDQGLLTVRFSGLWNVTKVIIVVPLKHDKWPLRLNSFMKKKNLPWQQHWDLITGFRSGGKNRDSHWLLSRETRQEHELSGRKEDGVRSQWQHLWGFIENLPFAGCCPRNFIYMILFKSHNIPKR